MSTTKEPPAGGGVYVVSVRREADRESIRAEAYAHVGLALGGVDLDQVKLPDPFTDAGFTVADLKTYIDHLTLLGTDPTSVPGDPKRALGDRECFDSEGHETDVFILGLRGEGAENWLSCAATTHTTWPRLLDVLGVSVGGVVFTDDVQTNLDLPATRVPKALRLKSGWDYDAEGNQVWLPIEEAWRRFVAHNQAHADGRRMGAKMMRRMRRHMEGFYAQRAAQRSGAE